LTKFTDEGAASGERRPGGRRYNFAPELRSRSRARGGDLHRLGLVTEERATSIVLTVQLANRLVRAPNLARPTRRPACREILCSWAAIVAVVSFFVNNEGDQLGVISPFAASSISSHHSRSCATRIPSEGRR
jgi:hypothetical protein